MSELYHQKRIIIIGSSTGGPVILEKIFSGLSRLDSSIIIVQHIRQVFVPVLAARIQSHTAMQVQVASDGQILKIGYVYVAQADYHLVLKGNRKISLNQSEKVNSVRPSIDVTMKSVIAERNTTIMGVILTGMGQDGTEGIRHIKEIGGRTIAQDPQTAPIRSMPQNAINTGGVDLICSPEEINRVILRFSNHS